jgi:uncharacterized protein
MRATPLSAAAARRIALAAQGFADPRPAGRVDRRHLSRVLGRMGLLQLDAVNVLARAHYLPVFARLGPYDPAALDRWAYRDGALFEYWGHEASLLPVDTHPLLRWRMARARRGEAWPGLVRFAREHPGLIDVVRDEIRARGPVRAGELGDVDARRRGGWWGWSDARRACEWLFWTGELAVAGRGRGWERVFDLTERVLPPDVLAQPTPSEADAGRGLLERAGRALGIGTARDLADYFRLRITRARPLLADLVEDGRLTPVAVEGWREPGYLHPDARHPRRITARALLSPFDPLVWARPRVARLFGFDDLVLEFYTPAARRRWGYYVLPLLVGEALVARADLKADRAGGVLRALAAYAEPDRDHAEAAAHLATALSDMAAWLGLDGVEAADRGDLAPALRRALRRPR